MTFTHPHESAIIALNSAYVKASGLSSVLQVGGGEKMVWWNAFIKHGFTMEQLVMVITHLQHQIRIGKRRPGCLKLSNLIGNLMTFEEELSQIKHAKHFTKRKPTPKEQVLAQSGRPTEPPIAIKRADTIAAQAFFALARQLKGGG